MLRTRKAKDLGRDARLLVHSIVTSREGTNGEFKLRGRALAEHDPRVQLEYANVVAAQLGWQPEPGRFHLFGVDIEDVTFIRCRHRELRHRRVARTLPPLARTCSR